MDENIKENFRIYEIGFLIVSTLDVSKAVEEAEGLKSFIQKQGGEVIGYEAPKLKNLAYKIIKKVGSENKRFTEGYFGWVKFETNPESLVEIKKVLDNNLSFLRYLLINTIRENTYLGESVKEIPEFEGEEGTEKDKHPGRFKKDSEDKKDKPQVVSQEEIDKSIEEMVKEV